MSEFFDKFWVGSAGAVAGAAINEVVHRLRARSALVATVADRYITKARTGDDSPEFRLGLMQSSGIALLSHRQFQSFIHEVTGRGCTHPFKDSDIEDSIPAKDLPSFVRACSERGFLLDTAQAVPIALANFLHEAEKKKAKESAK